MKNNGGLEKMVDKEYEKAIIVPDTHHPYHDEHSINSVLNFIKDQKPDKVILLGDHCDMYSVSGFDKNPDRAGQLQNELDVTFDFLSNLRRCAGFETEIIYLEGNHEHRLKRWLWKNPELHGLRSLSIPSLLGLKELGISYRKRYVWKNTLMFTHGKRITMYAPRWEIEDNGMSGMSGHTHRVNSHSKTDYSGSKTWHSIGHLCDPKKAEYTDNPNWQQAIGLVRLPKRGKDYQMEVIPINKNKFIYGNKLYTPNKILKVENGK